MKKKIRNWVSRSLVIALVLTTFGMQSQVAYAASVTSFSDNLSRLQASTAANHTIMFASPSGIQAGETVILTFAGFTGVSGILFSDIDFATGSSGTCTSATYTEQTLAGTASGATWAATSAGSAITITSGTGTSGLGFCMRIKIGTHTSNQSVGVNQITNGSSGTATLTLSGTFADTGVASFPIVASDQVVVTATVDATISFSLSETAVDFGGLTSGSAKFATGGAGSGGNASAATIAHNISASTNGTGGYIVYLLGGTLTSTPNTITAPTGPGASTVGSEQFGLHISDAGGGTGITVDSQYGTTSQYGWGSTSATQDTIATAAGATASNTLDATYVGNISSVTEAGNYSTTLTYTATSTF